jgi:hypothetical protein
MQPQKMQYLDVYKQFKDIVAFRNCTILYGYRKLKKMARNGHKWDCCNSVVIDI